MSEPKIEYTVNAAYSDYFQAARKEVNLQSFKLEFSGIKATIVVMNQRTFNNLSRAMQFESYGYAADLDKAMFCGLRIAILKAESPETSFELFIKVC